MKSSMIAPCGMNCCLCLAHLSKDRRCPGCRIRKKKCHIRTCPDFRKSKFKFCHECGKFPCKRIRHLDNRYRTRYEMSMIENLEMIRDKGMARFLASQKRKYINSEGILCVHDRKRYRPEK
jgi:hypothetical protein